jgi:hypothetical protein
MQVGDVPISRVTSTQVFIVRIWSEAQEADQPTLRIQVRCVLTGETRYFLEWQALTAFMAGKLEAADPIPGE